MEVIGLLNHSIPVWVDTIVSIFEMEGQRCRPGKELTQVCQVVVDGNASGLVHVFAQVYLMLSNFTSSLPPAVVLDAWGLLARDLYRQD